VGKFVGRNFRLATIRAWELTSQRRATDPSNVPNAPKRPRTLRRLAKKLDEQAAHLLWLFLLYPVPGSLN
jgi:hypothetical protein